MESFWGFRDWRRARRRPVISNQASGVNIDVGAGHTPFFRQQVYMRLC